MTEELRRELFYETHKHQLGPREVKQFFEFLESTPNLDEAVQHFIRTWEDLIEMIPSIRHQAKITYFDLKCIHCDEVFGFRDEGENAEYLWLHQITSKSAGLEPVTYCPLPYFVAEKAIKAHPEWKKKIRSSCNLCHEEITFPTNHRCLVPEWITSE